jgi:hypothetical protein
MTLVDRDALQENLTAELTLAAYRVALRALTEGTWLELELDLWRSMAATIKSWEGSTATAPSAGNCARPA